jgi:hypothetical protein
MLYAALKRRSSTVLQAGVVVDGRTALRTVISLSSRTDPRAFAFASRSTMRRAAMVVGSGMALLAVVVRAFVAMEVFRLARFLMGLGLGFARSEEG